MANINSVISTLNELKAMGISISIDDFGTSYSAFERTFLEQHTFNKKGRTVY